MSELLMEIGDGLKVLIDWDWHIDESESWTKPIVRESVAINAVCVDDIDIIDMLSDSTIETIEQNIFDSFDKELQEPERE
tara:strand:+ start:66 stop:305 length:240 start_codon:yes stop_codon:yes gene_type:complete